LATNCIVGFLWSTQLGWATKSPQNDPTKILGGRAVSVGHLYSAPNGPMVLLQCGPN